MRREADGEMRIRTNNLVFLLMNEGRRAKSMRRDCLMQINKSNVYSTIQICMSSVVNTGSHELLIIHPSRETRDNCSSSEDLVLRVYFIKDLSKYLG